jgi:hypothetical protein
MRKQKPGTQGLANLKTWRLPFSSDVKRRKRQTLENRRPHRLRGGSPDSVLGVPAMNWTEPPRLGRKNGVARNATPKRRGAPMHEPVFFARKVSRLRRRKVRI